MGNFIDVNNIVNANVNDKVILADKVLVKADNGMWVKPLAEQAALVALETNLDGGASADSNSFKDIEDKLNTITTDVGNRYTKSEIDAGLNNKADKATTLAGYGITIIDCGSIV